MKIGDRVRHIRSKLSVGKGRVPIKLRTQLLVTFLGITIGSLLIFGLLIYKNIKETITQQAEDYFVQSVEKDRELIDKELDYIEEFSYKLNIDSRLYDIFYHLDSKDEVQLKRANEQITNILNGYRPWESNIYSVHLVTTGYRFGEEDKNFYPKGAFYRSRLAEDAIAESGKLVWIPTYSYTQMFGIKNLTDEQIEYGSLFSAVRQMNLCDVSSGKVLRLGGSRENPILVVNFTEDFLTGLLQEYGEKDIKNSVNYMVLDGDGSVICTTDESYQGQVYHAEWLKMLEGAGQSGYLIERAGKEEALITWSKSAVTGWIVTATVPLKELTSEITGKILKYMAIIMLLLLFLSVGASYLISDHMNRKVYGVLNTIDSIGTGALGSEVRYEEEEEFAFFYQKINQMSRNLKNLVHENYEVKLQQREFELMILNIQLNPHFLYNTLNIINWTCLSGDLKKAGGMIVDLSRMLQYTSKNQNQTMPLMNDISWLKRYISIMQARYENAFEVRFTIPEELMRLQVPKLFLQPLIENAVVHGFKNLDRKGILEIGAEFDEKTITFFVEDNGRGMTQQRVEEVISRQSDSIGIANTDRRIKILYGPSYGIRIHSQPEEGTLVEVTVPAG